MREGDMEKLHKVVVVTDHANAGSFAGLIDSLREKFQVEGCGGLEESQHAIRRGDCSGVIASQEFLSSHGLELQDWLAEEKLDLPTLAIAAGNKRRDGKLDKKLNIWAHIDLRDETIACVMITNAIERFELQRHIRLLSEIVEHASDCIITMDTSGRMLTVNNAVEDIFGYRRHRLVGQEVTMLFPPENPTGRSEEIIKASRSGVPWEGEIFGKRSDGVRFPVQVSLSFVRDSDGKPQSVIAVARDITERQEMLSQLKRQSITDDLTGLFNYRYFHARLRYEFLRAKRYLQPLSCIMMDLDYFKAVNDAYGHQAGDEVLRAVAQSIRAATRDVDIVARYGGEEFVIVLPNTDIEGTLRCAEHVWQGIGTTDLPVRNSHIRITASLGVATMNPDITDEEELLRNADDALMEAKRKGRNNICIWCDVQAQEEVSARGELRHLDEVRSRLQRVVRSAKGTFVAAAKSIVSAVEARDPYSHQHTSDVTMYATSLAGHLGLSPEEAEVIRYAAMLHDLGRIVIDKSIFTKKAPLTDEEKEMVRRHPEAGEEVAAELGVLREELPLIRHHHERWDGKGYPDALVGEKIPLGARVLAIADAFDAMTSERPHRSAMRPKQANRELRRLAGKQFDPNLVELFLQIQEEMK